MPEPARNVQARETARQRLQRDQCAYCGRRPLATYYYCTTCQAAHRDRVRRYDRSPQGRHARRIRRSAS